MKDSSVVAAEEHQAYAHIVKNVVVMLPFALVCFSSDVILCNPQNALSIFTG